MAEYRPGDRITYEKAERRAGRLAVACYGATYVRSQLVSGRPMHVIVLDDRPGRPIQVGDASLRPA